MSDELPEEFDLVVIGTGFPESCVAAAASRIGKTVLHIDPNEFYGGVWASFNLEAFTLLIEHTNNVELRNASQKWFIEEESKIVDTPANNTDDTNTEKPDDVDASAKTMPEANVVENVWTRTTLMQQSRRFNLDICPKILYSSGPLVQLLVSSNICRYAEFRAVDRVCTRFQNDIVNVPCSRSDVFNTKDLNIVEKRLLMKFLTVCMSYGEDKCEEDAALYRGKTFREYLQSQKVTEKISSCVMQAIAMCNEETSFEEGMKRTQNFINSLGRYGNTPFLFPMYGCGEIPQCFCRLCAVFGGIYCLKRQTTDITIDGTTGVAQLLIEGKTIRARHVVGSHGNIPQVCLQRNPNIFGQGELINCLSRAIIISTTPLGNDELNSGGGGVNLLRLLDGPNEAILIQLSHFSGTCPKGIYIFHLTTAAHSDQPELDLQPFMAQVFGEKLSNTQMLYAAYFTITGRKHAAVTPQSEVVTSIFCTSAPYYELDYDKSILNAREIFAKMYTDAEFLPRAPDPEEIVIDGEDPRALSENSLPDDLREQLRELERSAERMDIEDAGSGEQSKLQNEPQDSVEQQQMDAE